MRLRYPVQRVVAPWGPSGRGRMLVFTYSAAPHASPQPVQRLMAPWGAPPIAALDAAVCVSPTQCSTS
eukprot:7199822-Pyramimonas_sp.AAC.1